MHHKTGDRILNELIKILFMIEAVYFFITVGPGVIKTRTHKSDQQIRFRAISMQYP